MKRRIIVPLAFVAASSLALAACSSDTTEPEASATDSVEPTTEVMAGCEDYAQYGTFDGGEVELYTTISGVEAENFELSLDKFEECTGLTVNYVSSDEFETEINIRIEGGNPPDLAIIPQPGLLQTVVGTGAVVPAPATVEANVDEFWSADWKAYGTVGTTFYAAPLMASVKGWIWYSPADFEANGYAVPATWGELMDLTATMAANGGTGPDYAPWCIGFESGTATGWAGTDWIEDIVLRESGADVYDQWITNDVKFSSPEITSAFEAFGAIALNEDYINGGLGGSQSIIDTPFQEGGLPILAGSCSMHHQASFYEAQWLGEGDDISVAPDGDIWAFLTPPMNEGDPAAVTGGGEFVTAFSDSAETAALQTFLASDTWANARVGLGGVISANKGLDATLASSPIAEESIRILQGDDTVFRFDGSDLMPSAVGASAFWTEITEYVGGKDLATVLTDIDTAWP